MKRFDEILKRWEAPFDKTEEQSWEAIQLKISSEIRPQTRVVGFRRYYWAAAAAVVVLALGIWWFLPAEDTMAVANTGKDPITITLPDGSKAVLNAGTTLSYAHQNDIRTVSLSGEAYFEVVHGKPFEVHGNQGVVRVLGTRFYVFVRAGM
ncbi:MAG: FecR domain-containing protein [Flavobacteriales bacterium]|nr:FecR domain-containing protein [Flavobacteriales bacterium]